VRTASGVALDLPTEERVARFGRPTLIEQFDSLPLEDFQQEFEGRFVDETYSFYPYELILPCTSDDLVLCDEPTSVRAPEGRIVAGFDVGRTRDRSELAVFEEIEGRFTCRMLKSFEGTPFAEQEAELRRLLGTLPVARLSIDRSGIGMNLAENLSRDFPQVVGENFTNEAKERWATDFKILLQRRDVTLPRDRELVGQVHAIKRRVLPSGKVSFDAERNARGHADKFWAVVLACQKERTASGPRIGEIGVRVLG
jgi:phage FluMu gp28-like protein